MTATVSNVFDALINLLVFLGLIQVDTRVVIRG